MLIDQPPFRLAVSDWKISSYAVSQIKKFEGFSSRSYKDIAGNITCGWGHKGNLMPLGWITLDQAEFFLGQDLSAVKQTMLATIKIDLLQLQFDAIADWIFNLGPYAWRTSAALAMLNAGMIIQCAEHMKLYNQAAGQVQPGLTARRSWEFEMMSSL